MNRSSHLLIIDYSWLHCQLSTLPHGYKPHCCHPIENISHTYFWHMLWLINFSRCCVVLMIVILSGTHSNRMFSCFVIFCADSLVHVWWFCWKININKTHWINLCGFEDCVYLPYFLCIFVWQQPLWNKR